MNLFLKEITKRFQKSYRKNSPDSKKNKFFLLFSFYFFPFYSTLFIFIFIGLFNFLCTIAVERVLTRNKVLNDSNNNLSLKIKLIFLLKTIWLSY